MKLRHDTRPGTGLVLRCCAMVFGVSLLAACSSSFGGGGAPSQPNTIIVPPNTAVVCQDGSNPPCH